MIKFASIGTVSEGTLRTVDLVEKLSAELEYHVQRNAVAWCCDAGRAQRDSFLELISKAQAFDEDDDSEFGLIVAELCGALEMFAPPCCYFGASEGDGADFGFWPCREQIEELPRLSDGPNDPPFADQARALGKECAFVNDHGNVTVYNPDGSIALELV